MLLILDNYDSFTYNLQQYFGELLQEEIAVFRNDEIEMEAVNRFDRIVLSPGPGLPKDAGILIPLIQKYAKHKPLLGVCLGHQAITEAFGGSLKQLENVLHGVPREVLVLNNQHPLFTGIPANFEAGRYHSWVADQGDFPADLEVMAVDNEDNIMMLKHRTFPVFGMQFHPESIMTPCGKLLLENWLSITK